MRNHPPTRVLQAILSCGLLAVAGCGGEAGRPEPPPACWQESDANPLIAFGDVFANAFWNDPTVLATPQGFRMWLTAGDLFSSPIRVEVFEAHSLDGLTWRIDPAPRLSPTGEPSDFDGLRVETPDVVLVDGRYHLYYSGCTGTCEDGVYAIGHATSEDGTRWSRDPANPVISAQPQPDRWGAYTAVEPGIVYEPGDGRFLLYYVGARTEAVSGRTELAILLATSPDGSAFAPVVDANGERIPVLRLPAGYPAEFAGVTQPEPYRDAQGRIHLFYTVVAALEPLTTHAMAHAVSDDGLHFTEVERDILPAGAGDWKTASGGRAAAVIATAERLQLWFQGNSDLDEAGFSAGIGYAERTTACRRIGTASPEVGTH